jgi:hypothetical protein
MGKGDCIFIDAVYFQEPPEPMDMGVKMGADCCYELPVFWSADTSNPDYKYMHDVSSWIVFCDQSIISVNVILERYYNGWQDVATLTTDIYGKYFALGFIENRFNQKAIGYLLDWNLVYTAFGNADYRLRFDQTYKLGITQPERSFSWHLRQYSIGLADKTVRLEWMANGIRGWWNKGRADFMGANFLGQIRLPKSAFGYPKDAIEEESYLTQEEEDRFLKLRLIERYQLEVIQAPPIIHEYLKIVVRLSYKVKISDYNIMNPQKFRDYECIFKSGSEPNWNFGTQLATVQYDLEEYIKNKTVYK